MYQYREMVEGGGAAPAAGPSTGCAHDHVISDGDFVECCNCAMRLVMLPDKPGEFKLEWVRPRQPAWLSL